LPRAFTSRGFFVSIEQQEVCPHIPLPSDFETYLGMLDKKQRHELRRKLRRAEGAPGEKVEWYIVGPDSDLDAAMETFAALMIASHPNKAKFMDDPQNAAFFRAIVPRIAACGWLQLAFLAVNGDPAAAYLNFDYGNRILVYNSGLRPDRYAHLSPGIVLLAHLIEHAIQLGRRDFDFLRGTEEYKYRMGGQDRPVMRLKANL
ncbi:MAG TPA: GNAT family N-acetyltransferase, partial [Aggregatilineales bacterium]|nr:GNAT family N-acetyltransferase [Aggregatilineales bacterium]